jgi:hypothetical protein
MTDELGLNEHERETLAIAQEMHTLSLHGGWRRVRTVLRQWELEALYSMEECKSSSDAVRSNLMRRWEERRDTNKMLDNYLADILEQRKSLLREIAESRGNTPEEAFNLVENF